MTLTDTQNKPPGRRAPAGMTLIALLLSLGAPARNAEAQVDKDALPPVEKGFEINFFVKEPHIILSLIHI